MVPGGQVRTASSSRQPAGSRTVGLVVSLVAIVATLLIVEVALRFTHAFGAHLSWSEPDPTIGYRHTPNRTYWNFKENDHPITGRINSFGWRDRERSLQKPPGAYRVAFLGDSFVVALQVESDSTFLALAEDELTTRLGRPVEIMNFGRSGATQTEEFLMLQSDVMRFSPDLVAVLFVAENDIGDVANSTTGSLRPFYELTPDGELVLDTSFNTSRSYRARAAINDLKQRSVLVSLLVERYNLLARARRVRIDYEVEEGLPRHLTLCTSHPDPAYARNYRLNKILIREMARYCRQRGARFLLVCGDSVYETEDILKHSTVDPTFDPDFFEADLAELADSLGADYLGLQTPFREHVTAGGTPLHWGHYNYAGHRMVARELSNKLAGIISESASRALPDGSGVRLTCSMARREFRIGQELPAPELTIANTVDRRVDLIGPTLTVVSCTLTRPDGADVELCLAMPTGRDPAGMPKAELEQGSSIELTPTGIWCYREGAGYEPYVFEHRGTHTLRCRYGTAGSNALTLEVREEPSGAAGRPEAGRD